LRSSKTTVLFVCTHNSARSQIAEGLLQAFHGDRFEAFSAGTEPTTVHPMAVKAMAELGIDISRARSKSVDGFRERKLDYVVTVCDRAHQNCPFFAGGKHQLHKGFGDPAQPGLDDATLLGHFMRTRDEIRDWLEEEFVPMASGSGPPAQEGAQASGEFSGWKNLRFSHKDT
jgi:arsenate reductase